MARRPRRPLGTRLTFLRHRWAAGREADRASECHLPFGAGDGECEGESGAVGKLEAPGSDGSVGSPGRLGLSGSEGRPGLLGVGTGSGSFGADGVGTGTLGLGTSTFGGVGAGTGTEGTGSGAPASFGVGVGTLPPPGVGGVDGFVGAGVLGFGTGAVGGLPEDRHLLSTSAVTSETTPRAAVAAPATSGIPDRSLTRPNRSASTLATFATQVLDGAEAPLLGTFGRHPAFCRAVTPLSALVIRFVASSMRGGFAIRSELMPGSCATRFFASSEHCEFGGVGGVGVGVDTGGLGGLGCPWSEANATAGAATDTPTATESAAAPTAREILTFPTAP